MSTAGAWKGTEHYWEQLESDNPDLTDDELAALTARFVSPPELAPHPSGTAINLTSRRPPSTPHSGSKDVRIPISAAAAGSLQSVVTIGVH